MTLVTAAINMINPKTNRRIEFLPRWKTYLPIKYTTPPTIRADKIKPVGPDVEIGLIAFSSSMKSLPRWIIIPMLSDIIVQIISFITSKTSLIAGWREHKFFRESTIFLIAF